MRIEDRWKAVVTNIQFHLAALILGANQKSHDLWEDWEQECEWVKFDKETETYFKLQRSGKLSPVDG